MTVPRLPLDNLSNTVDLTPVAPFTPLATFGATTPHTLPLLVKLPQDSKPHQLDISPTAPLSTLRDHLSGKVGDDMDIYFGDMLLDKKNDNLEDCGVSRVYETVGGMLGVIKEGGLDLDKKVRAVEETVGVVKEMKKRENNHDMGRIVEAALGEDGLEDMKLGGIMESKGKKGLGAGLNELELCETPRMSMPAPPTPSQLIRSLSKMQPDLFPPASARKVLTADKIQEKMGKNMQGGVHQFRENTWFDGVVKTIGENMEKTEDNTTREVSMSSAADDDTAMEITNSQNTASTSCKRYETTKSHPQSGQTATVSESSGHSSHAHAVDSPMKRKSNISSTASTDSKQQSPGGSTKVPRKRGRKRKHPELSDEERKAMRQAQNRESAKQSRIRRKTMAAEYERKMSTLNKENDALRDQVSLLNNRLSFLQSLLTVSVNPKKLKESAGKDHDMK